MGVEIHPIHPPPPLGGWGIVTRVPDSLGQLLKVLLYHHVVSVEIALPLLRCNTARGCCVIDKCCTVMYFSL